MNVCILDDDENIYYSFGYENLIYMIYFNNLDGFNTFCVVIGLHNRFHI